MAFAEDFSQFFDTTNGFAVVGTHSGNSYNGIFDNEYAGEGMIAGTIPTFTLESSDASNMAIGDQITINAVVYLIREKQQDGTGVSILILEEN